MKTYFPIYTVGYSGHSLDDLATEVENINGRLIDIRLVPSSRMPGWNKVDIVERLGKRYRHLPQLGNKNALTGGPIAIANLPDGLWRVWHMATKQPIFLLCGCQNFQTCHRRVLSEELRMGRRIQVEEWSWPVRSPAPGKLKALTIWQPHASLFFLPEERRKLYETRGYPTSYRGPVVIHAGKNPEDLTGLCRQEPFQSALTELARLFGYQKLKDVPRGAAIGVADLTECYPTNAVPPMDFPARHFGDFGPGRFAWRMDNPRPFPTPIPIRGQQGLFDVEIDLRQALQGNLHGRE